MGNQINDSFRSDRWFLLLLLSALLLQPTSHSGALWQKVSAVLRKRITSFL